MAQVDKLNYLPLVFWFMVFFIVIYFSIFVRIIPMVFTILKARQRIFKKLFKILKFNLRAFNKFFVLYIALNRFILTNLVRVSNVIYIM